MARQHKPLLIVITGPPGAGKSELAQRISDQFDLPVVSKDDFKEAIFDRLGWKDRAWSRRVGKASYILLYRAAATFLSQGQSCILVSNFDPTYDDDEINGLKDYYQAKTLQIFLTSNVQTLAQRFIERAQSGERHPGHVDHQITYEDFEAMVQNSRRPLNIGGQLHSIDATDLSNIDVQLIFDMINGSL